MDTTEHLHIMHAVHMARAECSPHWIGIRNMYNRMNNAAMRAAVADIIAGRHQVDLRQLAKVESIADFRALLCNRTAPPPTERDARVDELVAEMAALRLKREAREADLAAKNRANEAARRERVRSDRAARAAARAAAQTREPALVQERPRAGPKRSPRAPRDAAGAARDTAAREAGKAAAADHAKALRDREAARQAELEARAEYARIGHAIQRG